MRCRTAALVVAVAACALLPACGAAGSATGDVARLDEAFVPPPVADDLTPELPVTVGSADGRDVTVRDVDRIVPLSGSLAEVVVARDISTTFAQAAHLPLVTHAHDVSAEGVLSVGATVVLAQPDTGPPEALDQIRAAGVPVVVFDLPTQLEDVSTHVQAIAAALGVPSEGATLAERTEAAIVDAQRAIPHDEPPPRVAFLYMRGTAGVYLIAGDGSGADSMIEAAGGIDAGTAMGIDKPFTPITSEALVEAAPDVILMTTTGLESVGGIDGLLEIPGIAQTPAGRQRRVITQEDGLLFGFGARTPAALTTLIGEIHGRAH